MQPMMFVGHGSPMNAIEINRFTETLRQLGQQLRRSDSAPTAILIISAHWDKAGFRVNSQQHPRTLHDFGGFVPELYQQQYPASGAPKLAEQLLQKLQPFALQIDNSWGFDHGVWSVLCHLYPDANIPVLQLSVDSLQTARQHYELGRSLKPLRDLGVLLLGSGNIVHNLARLDWLNGPAPRWAQQFLQQFKTAMATSNIDDLLDYRSWPYAALAVPHADHLLPFYTLLGASDTADKHDWFNDDFVLGNLAMSSLLWQQSAPQHIDVRT